jgi:8-oxo-dGTP pyrophosphatase MutT (NUDIX family)
MHKVASAFLQLPNGKIVCQIRGNIPNISSPGMISPFGGGVEGDETFEQGIIRELKEELNLNIEPRDLILLGETEYFSKFRQKNSVQWGYLLKINNLDILELNEGVGIAIIDPKNNPEQIYMSDSSKSLWKLMQEYLKI